MSTARRSRGIASWALAVEEVVVDFLIGPVLTLAVIPALYVMSCVSGRQVRALRLNRSAT
jgi:hypothetical protein